MDIGLLGVYNATSLAHVASEKRQHLVQDLLFEKSVNIAVGDSGLGKTALLMSLGVAVAAGIPWLGRQTTQGPVLFVDGESPQREFLEMLQALSTHLGLEKPPENFFIYSPQWDQRPVALADGPVEDTLHKQIEALRPSLVIVDPLRMFWPNAETKSEEAIKMLQYQRRHARDFGTSWLTLHHRRKTNAMREANLVADVHSWMQEAAGARSLVNQTDTRIGIDKSDTSSADLVLAGFARILGPVPPIRIVRKFDDDGNPQGYRALEGLDHLANHRHKELLLKLPHEFRYKDVHTALNNSGGATSDFLEAVTTLQLVSVEGEGRFRRYRKRALATLAPDGIAA